VRTNLLERLDRKASYHGIEGLGGSERARKKAHRAFRAKRNELFSTGAINISP
jgi:hypothetical protein